LLQSANVVGRAERSIRRLLDSYQPSPNKTIKADQNNGAASTINILSDDISRKAA
jgi:hypothetical protein